MESPIIVAVLALLGIPAVTSAVTGLIKYVSDVAGVSPKVVVYLVSLFVTAIVIAGGSATLPAWADDPVTWVAAWLTWATVNAELARRIYELLWERLYDAEPY